ncbi:hypothetical protein AB9K26_00735 [Psychroserpens sp. XS_ASV72]|uniref:hypothetical protein n=1 Tax=Psychroserpens sp. XS_ASV72 TaxID=3241293 RepID=UPI00351116CC
MKHVLNIAIEDLGLKKQKDYAEFEKLLISIIDSISPKKSISLGSNLTKKIFEYDNELNIVLVGHLYLEKYLNEILDKNLKSFETLEKRGILNSFYKKVTYLKAEKITPNELLDNITVYNKMRNKFAHHLNYDISEFNVFEFSYLKKYESDFNVKRKKEKRILHRILVRLITYHIMVMLTRNHSYLHLLNED